MTCATSFCMQKPGNLLVNSNCDLSLCDFGLSRRLPVPPDQSTDSAPSESSSNVTQRQAEMTELVQTRWYRGPEVICASKVCPYDEKIDIWGVGCILGEILTRKPLFAGDDHWQQLQYIIEQLGAPPAEEVNEIDPRQSERPGHREALIDALVKRESQLLSRKKKFLQGDGNIGSTYIHTSIHTVGNGW
uniref:Protein kinase domain-containing protein n=1 Tax=Chromera velia CCMP2878 TaxID=1169474 RepID=A0A0G4HSR9_9ALVE|eukprot:Cvel_8340.t1-p1 / transcript=Cvel_8340.t1 / gene=Cvel_8340 / organism=Chromera_velia_CCMP2878 / gene_product=Mitogen-activated protein kinase CPK1, putative / transcript_product=Mitogen-activated protein kinase CPK1, putative / location=Cvel_scaffold459:16055-21246(-) / protein_length=188 / sequence_SO=supercontig / SO=protein_coding / is_pseudo=false